MLTRQHSTLEGSTSTRSHLGIVPEDMILERTSESGNANNGEDNNDTTPPLELGTTARIGDDDRDDSLFSSNDSRSRLLVYSQRCIGRLKKVKKIREGAEHCQTLEQQQWKTTIGITIAETSSKIPKRMKRIKIDAPTNLNSADKKTRDLQYLNTSVNVIQGWKPMPLRRNQTQEIPKPAIGIH